ncbi:MAG: DegV family protein [Eubacteriales bacterium]
MDKIKFIMDSSGGISKEDAERLNIEVVPTGIIIDGKLHKDGVDIDSTEFLAYLRTCKTVPSTSAVNPEEWYEVLKKYVISQEFTHIVVSTLASTVSGGHNNAVSARERLKEEFPEKFEKLTIYIYDSGNSTIALGYSMKFASQLHIDGANYPEIETFLKDWYNSVEVYFAAFSFDLPRLSGRINSSSAYIGARLKLRPIMKVCDGKFTLINKVRGDIKVATHFLEIAQERMRENSPYFFMSGDHPTIAQTTIDLFEEAIGYPSSGLEVAGPSMTLNGGPDMFCVCFLSKNRNSYPDNPR